MPEVEKSGDATSPAAARWCPVDSARGLARSWSHRRRVQTTVSHPWRSRRPQTTHIPSMCIAAGTLGHLEALSALVDGGTRLRRYCKEAVRYCGVMRIRACDRRYLLYTQFPRRRSVPRCYSAPSDAERAATEDNTDREQRGEVIAVEPFVKMTVWRRWPATWRRRNRPLRSLAALPAAA